MSVQVENLDKVFNLSPVVVEGEFTVENKEIVTASPSLPTIVSHGKLDDSDYIRDNLKELAKKTKEALDIALQVQADDPHFKNTEAVSKIADAVAKTLSNLMHLNKIEKDEASKSKHDDVKVVNNNLIVTTTEDLISKIVSQTKQLKDKNDVVL